MHAELEGVSVAVLAAGSSPLMRCWPTVLLPPQRLDRDEALAELARRYLRSHGPATVRDFVWWSGLSTADARRGLEINRALRREVDGLTYWTLGPKAARVPRLGTGVHLLPIYDEYLVAYRDHRVVPRPAYVLGGFQHALLAGGQVAGTWSTIPGGDGLMVDVRPVRRLTLTERRALAQAASRYRRFLGVPVSLSVT